MDRDVDIERADRYIQLARFNVDRLMGRWQIERKIHFGIWTAYVLVPYGICKLPSTFQLGRLEWLVFGSAYILSAVAYHMHTKRLLGSNEIDITWWLYLKDKAEHFLGGDVPEESIQRPGFKLDPLAEGRKRLKKERTFRLFILLAYILAVAGVMLLAERTDFRSWLSQPPKQQVDEKAR